MLHLLYVRFWHKVLYDLGHVSSKEPFRRLVNQGYISAFAYTDERGFYVPAAEVVEKDGQFLFEGRPVTFSGPRDAAGLGIEIVYQDLALCDNLDVVQNMYLGRETHDPLFRLREAPMERRTAETLKSLSVTTIRSVRQAVATLSGGQRQSVAVARAVLWNNKIVFLDEPTAALGVAQTRQVLDLVKRLAEQGLAVVLVSHNLVDVFEVADRITVLRLGRNVGVYEKDKTNEREIVEAITFGAPAPEETEVKA